MEGYSRDQTPFPLCLREAEGLRRRVTRSLTCGTAPVSAQLDRGTESAGTQRGHPSPFDGLLPGPTAPPPPLHASCTAASAYPRDHSPGMRLWGPCGSEWPVLALCRGRLVMPH